MTKGILQSKIVWAAALMLVFSIAGILTGKAVPADTADQIIGLDWSNVAPAILSTLIILFRVFASGTKLSGWFGVNVLLPLLLCCCLLPSCKKDVAAVQIVPVPPALNDTVQDRAIIIDIKCNLVQSFEDEVSVIRICTDASSIPTGTRMDVYACAVQSAYSPEPTSGFQLLSQHGPGALSGGSLYESAATYNSLFSTPYAPAGRFIWFKVQEVDISGDVEMVVQTSTFGQVLTS